MTGLFYVKSRQVGRSMLRYKGNAMRISKQYPCYVDEVVLALKNDPDKIRKVTTYRDKNGKMLERAFDFFDQPLRNVIYDYQKNTIGNCEHTNSRIAKEYYLDRCIEHVYKDHLKTFKKYGIPTTLWELNNIETNIVSKNAKTGEVVHSQIKVLDLDKPQQERHFFYEFPHIIKSKIQEGKEKLLAFKVDRFSGNEIKKNSIQALGVTYPENDKYLSFRALDLETFKKPITQFYLKERKVNSLGVVVLEHVPKTPKEERLYAFYSDSNGTIRYNKFHRPPSKSIFAGIARHEVEHVWHYLLSALFYGSENPKAINQGEINGIIDKNGKFIDKKLFKEAENCAKSIENYIPYNVSFQEYENNYIEKCARKAESTAQADYIKNCKDLKNSFKHIPLELL